MCGICGLFGKFDRERIGAMTDSLSHRGPDDKGIFLEPSHSIALGHRRLSIIDLEGGAQPIYNEDNSVVVVFNGEIYNYIELREELKRKGHKFSTNSDTETILHLYEEEKESFPEKLNGCFAIALYDLNLRKLFLVRDRLGIRPLYYHYNEDGLIFASEPKALFESGYVEKKINNNSLASFLRFRYVPGPNSIFDGIKKLLPGHMISITQGDLKPKIEAYWNIDNISSIQLSDNESIDRFEELLLDSVKIRMRSDVPVSAFLSGGLDSSLIVRLMSEFGQVYRAYSIGFHLSIDENKTAKEFSARLGIPHRDIYVEKDAYKDLPRVVGRMDEPVGDVIILPTHTLAESVSREAKVVMTGEGADEVWGGYLHHYALHYLNEYSRRNPGWFINGAKIISRLPVRALSSIFPYPAELGKKGKEKLERLLQLAQRPKDAYLLFASFCPDKDLMSLLGRTSNQYPPFFGRLNQAEHSILNRILSVERRAWLPDYTLCKQDTLTMANSLEGRVPYLDHRIVEFAAGLEDKQKIRRFRSKYLLRKVAERYIGRDIAWRAKKAFYIPTEQCFGTDYSSMSVEYFDPIFVKNQGVFDPESFSKIISQDEKEILNNKLKNTLLIFQMWYKHQFCG